MKAQIQRFDPTRMAVPSAPYATTPGDADAPEWVIEEIGEAVSADQSRTGGERWLCLAIAALGALTGFGFIGRMTDGGSSTGGSRGAVATSEPSGSPTPVVASRAAAAVVDAPLELTSPAEGDTIESTVLNVVGVAHRRLGTVHLAVVLGGAVLGSTDVDVRAAGPITAAIPVFAPPVGVRVELVATFNGAVERVGPGSAAPRAAPVRRSFVLRPGGPLALWPARVLHSRTATTLSVSGYAPVGVGRVRIRVVSETGRTLGRATAVVAMNGARAGSVGGYALGLGSFDARLALVAHLGPGPVRIEVDWRDAIGGEWGTTVLTVTADGSAPPHRP